MRNYDFSKFPDGVASARRICVRGRGSRWRVMACVPSGHRHCVYKTVSKADALNALVELTRMRAAGLVMLGMDP